MEANNYKHRCWFLFFALHTVPFESEVPSSDCSVHCATQDQRRYRPQPKPQDQTNPPHTAVWHHPPAPPNNSANTPSTYYRVRHSSNPQYPEITQHRDVNYSHHHTPITPTSAPPAPAHVFVYSNEIAPASSDRVSFEPEDTTIDHNELKRLPILFYHRTEPHFGFTNFSAHPVEYDGRVYPTSEHLFQAFKVRLSPRWASGFTCVSEERLILVG